MPFLRESSEERVRASESAWVPLGDDKEKTITSTRRDWAIRLSRELAVSSPLYSRLVSSVTDHVFPPGTQLVVPDMEDTLKPAVDWFWSESPTNIINNSENMIETLVIDGELVLRPRVNEGDGRVTLTNLDPDNISSVVTGEGLNSIIKLGFRDDNSDEDVEYDVIRNRAGTGRLEGDVFYFRLSPAGYTCGLRGLPLYIALLDEVASGTEFTYSRLTRLADMATFYWDVTIEGATQDKVDEFLSSERAVPPESGEMFAHNERVAWNLVTADIEDMADEMSFYVNFLMGAAGLSPEFMGHAPSRDISTESLFAAISHLQMLRAKVFHVFDVMLRYQLEQAFVHDGAVTSIPTHKLMAQEIGTRGMERASRAFARYADGLSKAVGEDLIVKSEASKVLKLLLSQLGFTSEDEMPEPFSSKRFVRTSVNEGKAYVCKL